MRAMTILPRAMLFDLDDTILSAHGKPAIAWSRIADEFAPAFAPLRPADVATALVAQAKALWNDESRHKYWRHRLDEARIHIVAGALADLGCAGDAAPASDLARNMARRFHELREAEMYPFPGACETLDALKQLGVRLALITNGTAEPKRAKVVRFALEHRFEHIQIEGEHGFGKPEERAYTHAMETLGVVPAETWMVGDNLEWEVAAPQRLRIYSIWCDAYGVGLPADSPIRPDRIIRSLPELI
jgi:putative hydrolase of the HAD superfamily